LRTVSNKLLNVEYHNIESTNTTLSEDEENGNITVDVEAGNVDNDMKKIEIFC